MTETSVICPACLHPQSAVGHCERCGAVLAPGGVTCREVIGTPSPARVSLRGEKAGEAWVVRLQRLVGDSPDAERARSKALRRAAEVPGVAAWWPEGVAQRDGAGHWVLTRRWVEGESLRAWRDRTSPDPAAVLAALGDWFRVVQRVIALGAKGIELSQRAENIILTAEGPVAVDLVVTANARGFAEQGEDLAVMIASLVDGPDRPRFERFLQKLRAGGYASPDAVHSALRSALGLQTSKPAVVRTPPVPEAPVPVAEVAREETRVAEVKAPSRGAQLGAGERIIEMTWRCSSCSHRNLGRHKVCVPCGSPKDGSESWEMPEDTSKAASVTQADLLRMALDGPDWRCAYCGSDQRRADRSCERCGASALEGGDVTEPDDPPMYRARRGGPPWHRLTWVRALAAALGVLVVILGVWAWRRRPRDLTATVTERSWRHAVVVERWAIRTREGFAENQRGEVFDVTSLGPRVHHHERVLDGYDTQHYTEQVACGQDCTETPRSCSEQCSSNSNGFATCRTVCSGGGRSCSTRYCSESRTRQVARYRSEPRYATAYRWRVWDWATQRTLVRAGREDALTWPPDEEVALNRAVGDGEREREARVATYRVTLRDTDEDTWRITVPTAEDFARFTLRSEHALHTERGRATINGRRWEGLP